MYYGNASRYPQIGGLAVSSPVQRFNNIVQIAAQNQVDVVFLQEHPGYTSQFTDHNGFLNQAQVPPSYHYQVFPEMNPQITNRVSASNRSYALVFRNSCVLNQTQFFNQANFVNPLNSALRCPVLYEINKNGTGYFFLNWHNEVANDAYAGMNILVNTITNNYPQNTIIVGDLNLSARDIDHYIFFNNWYDVVVDQQGVHGVDHILTLLNNVPHMGNDLDFVSDANHYPIAADIA